jgi:hypothetical protein
MNRKEFIQHLEDGLPATIAVRAVTGNNPQIVTIAEGDDAGFYTRYGIMMAGPVMAALVILTLKIDEIPDKYLARIRAGEPCGKVLPGMKRMGFVLDYGHSIKCSARLDWNRAIVGQADEIFTKGLFP